MELIEVVPLKNINTIRETLSRMGIGNEETKTVYPSCYLHKANDKFFIVHFKQLFKIFNPDAYENITEEDCVRRNAIVYLLYKWKLISVDISYILNKSIDIFVLPYNEKINGWKIIHKVRY